jgi:Uma2 family endonuclease
MTQAIAVTPEIANNTQQLLWTSADLELMPDNGNRYEIINGELFVTRAPHWKHQTTVADFLLLWICGRLPQNLAKPQWAQVLSLAIRMM